MFSTSFCNKGISYKFIQHKLKKGKTENEKKLKWFVTKLDQKVKVCNTFFLNTTNYKYRRQNGQNSSAKKKCYYNRINRVNETYLETVREHIKSFKAIQGHYCRKDSTKLHLP